MNTKEIFNIGCNKIHENFIDFGFKAIKKGQVLKKSSDNRLFDFVITFSSSSKNWSGSVAVIPYISVESKQLKKWRKEKYNSEDVSAIIFRTSLESITPLKGKNNEWNMAINNQENSIPKLSETIKKYVFPIFEKFENIEHLLREITQNGLQLNEHFNSKNQNLPIDFLLYYGDLKTAEVAFNNYLNTQKLKGRATSFYKKIEEDKNTSYGNMTDITMKKAFINELKIQS
ncbi:DUF4304 domain-containing protein [Maribacter forsetii]|uniref:DUF4304 domain-containing protein n=1 Tax=Maribacter forsetii TaxID=444515 RepID=UPI001427E6A2|nr:DUF4304 domain-containing protein [Maribacter forsetii]